MAELTDKQKRFCEEYLIDFNATKAAMRAGYSKHSANEQGCRLLTKDPVIKYLAEKSKRITDKLEISQQRTMQELGRIAFSDLRKAFDENGVLKHPTQWDDETAAAIAGLEIEELFAGRGDDRVEIGQLKKLKLWDKAKALEMLAKHFKIFTDAPTTNNSIKVGYGKEE